MTPGEELQNLLQTVQSPEIRKALTHLQSELQLESETILSRLDAHINQAEDSLKADWARFKAWL